MRASEGPKVRPARGGTERSTIVALIRDRLHRDSFPRLVVFTIVLIAGGCAFLFSALTLAAGLHSMGLRYGLAAITGYLSFALLLRGWIAMRKSEFDFTANLAAPDLDVSDVGASARDATRFFAGGRSGGGGSSGSWAAAHGEARSTTPLSIPLGSDEIEESGAGSVPDIFDSDDGWKIVLAVALVLGAVLAAGFVVYTAPTLLAEVALDAGVMTAVYRKIRYQEPVHWTGTVLRQTWVPALVIIVCVTGAGYLLQTAVPEARSIGGVVRALKAS